MNENKGALPPLSAADLALLKAHIASQGLPAQVAAITAASPLTVVSAGAGTGKTWTLAWRFVWTALTRTDARHILTLTFTEKAAAEMRARIAKLLADLEPVLRESEELSQRRIAALEGLDQAYISTMHGFGARVISEAGLSLPVEPSLRLISAPEAEEFWSELSGALDRLDVDWFCAGMNDEYQSFARALLSKPEAAQTVSCWGAEGIASFAREFESLLADCGCTPESVLAEAAGAAETARELLARIVDRECEQLTDRWADALDIDPADFGKSQLGQKIAFLREKWLARGFESAADVREFLADAAEAVKGARGKLADALANELGMAVKEWRDRVVKITPFVRVVSEGFSEAELKLRAVLAHLACLAWRKWDDFRDRRGALAFSDMISLAGRALRASPDYAARFAEVLVDEFQDTNGTQNELLSVIRETARARLFIVGDLKQSIYRFRHAEPALFERYVQEAQNGGGDYIRLSVSFRSGERVLDAVNERFGGIWARSLGEGLNVPYEPLESPRGLERASSWIDERQGTTLPVCERLIEEIRRDENDRPAENISDARDRLALRLALRLSRLKKDGALVWDRDHLRPVSWGDMAVLVPTRSSYEPLQRAFSLAGVPAVFAGSRSFYARTEIRDAVSLAAFLADPNDAAALGGFLCSPFSGLPQAEAQALLPLLGSDPLAALDRERPELAAQLRELVRTARLKGSSAALATLLARGDRLSGVHPRKRGAALANLRRAVGLLEDYEASVGPSPVGEAAYLRRALRSGADDPEASAESAEDTVTVMTVHASKGLQFPLVVVFSLDHGSRSTGADRTLAPSRELLAAPPRYPDEWGGGDCFLGEVRKKLEERAEYEERQRLYYVALTRARDGLILCGVAPRGGELSENDRSLLSIEAAAGPFTPLAEAIAPGQVEAARRDNAAGTAVEETRGPDVPALAARPRSLHALSATSFALWRMCPAAWRMISRQKLDLSWNAAGDESDAEGGSSGGTGLGSVAHWLLSKWNFDDADYLRLLSLSDGHLRPEFRSVWRDGSARAELRDFLNGFHSAAGEVLLARLKRADAAGDLRREFPFRVSLGRFDLTGAVDAFWIECDETGAPARLCVRDYKTTRLWRHAARQRWQDDYYAAQLAFYAFALRRAFPEYAALPLDLALWNLRSGTEQKLRPFGGGEEAEIETTLSQMAEQAAAGPWPPSRARCEGCAYARGCVFRDGE